MKQTMKMKLVVLGLVGLSMVVGACNNGNNNSDGESQVTIAKASSAVQGETTVTKEVVGASDIQWEEKEQVNFTAQFSFKVPKGWERKRNGGPTTLEYYGSDETSKKLLLAHEGFLVMDDKTEAAIKTATLDTLPELLDEQFTAYSTLGGRFYVDTLTGTETSRETVTINGQKMLRVVGKVSNKGEDSLNYLAYYGFMTNEAKKTKDIPFVIAVYINSEDSADITYGEKMLDAIIQTVKPREK